MIDFNEILTEKILDYLCFSSYDNISRNIIILENKSLKIIYQIFYNSHLGIYTDKNHKELITINNLFDNFEEHVGISFMVFILENLSNDKIHMSDNNIDI